MTYIVELRYIGGDLGSLMRDMRIWLGRNQIEPEEFHHASAPPGVAFRVGFSDQDHAAAFAGAFKGRLECGEPQGTETRWTIPTSSSRTSIQSMPGPRPSRSALPRRR
jgi:hypothetical protein